MGKGNYKYYKVQAKTNNKPCENIILLEFF